MNKKGFIRTMEAVISIILLFSFIFFMSYYRLPEANDVPFVVKNTHEFLFEEISYNNTLRDCVIEKADDGNCAEYNAFGSDACMGLVSKFIESNTPVGYQHACEICSSAVSCIQETLPIDRNVYANSLFLAATNSKIMRIYFWEE